MMKNATKHAERLHSLFRGLLRGYKPEPREQLDPLKALVRGAMCYDVSDTRADEAMKLLEAEFVEFNELRVATELEVQELLGQRYPAIEERVQLITRTLNAIFEREHTLSLDRLKTVSRREARHFLHDLPDMNQFVEGYVMLYAIDGAAVPVDHAIADYLSEEKVTEGRLSIEEVQRFVEHHLKAEECYDFFKCVRRASQDEHRKPKKK